MTEHAAETVTCNYPGCQEPPAPPAGAGRPPEYCTNDSHNRVTAWRERKRLEAEGRGDKVSEAQLTAPVTTARRTGADLMRDGHALAARLADTAEQLRGSLAVIGDPSAHEAETDAARAAAEQRATAAEARAANAEQSRVAADAAAEEMAASLEAAQAAARQARDDLAAARREHDAETERIRTTAASQVAAAEVDRDRATERARLAAAAAEREVTRAQAAEGAARAEAERLRADAARERDELRAVFEEARTDLRARAERAEAEADALRAELIRARAGNDPEAAGTPRRTRRRTSGRDDQQA